MLTKELEIKQPLMGKHRESGLLMSKVLLKYLLFLDSSAVEQQTVNLLVRGSIPRRGAKLKFARSYPLDYSFLQRDSIVKIPRFLSCFIVNLWAFCLSVVLANTRR